MNSRWISFFFSIFLTLYINGQEEYCEKYPLECNLSLDFLVSHKPDLDSVSKQVQLPVHFIYSIVAPEITQYNFIRNKLESYTLNVLYVQNGRAYADYSIGFFQMKPSFIEDMEKYIQQNAMLSKKYSKHLFLNPMNKNSRIGRVKRLNSIHWQIKYLGMFCDIMKDKFRTVHFSNQEEKLKFYASAYNSGFKNNENFIREMQNKAYFPRFSIKKFNYSDLSYWFFNECRGLFNK